VDWDYFAAPNISWNNVEFLYYLKKYKYKDYLTSDNLADPWDIKRYSRPNSRSPIGSGTS